MRQRIGAAVLICAVALASGYGALYYGVQVSNILGVVQARAVGPSFTDPVIGTYDPANPQLNPVSGCLAAFAVSQGYTWGSIAILGTQLGLLIPHMPSAEKTTCKNAVTNNQDTLNWSGFTSADIQTSDVYLDTINDWSIYATASNVAYATTKVGITTPALQNPHIHVQFNAPAAGLVPCQNGGPCWLQPDAIYHQNGDTPGLTVAPVVYETTTNADLSTQNTCSGMRWGGSCIVDVYAIQQSVPPAGSSGCGALLLGGFVPCSIRYQMNSTGGTWPSGNPGSMSGWLLTEDVYAYSTGCGGPTSCDGGEYIGSCLSIDKTAVAVPSDCVDAPQIYDPRVTLLGPNGQNKDTLTVAPPAISVVNSNDLQCMVGIDVHHQDASNCTTVAGITGVGVVRTVVTASPTPNPSPTASGGLVCGGTGICGAQGVLDGILQKIQDLITSTLQLPVQIGAQVQLQIFGTRLQTYPADHIVWTPLTSVAAPAGGWPFPFSVPFDIQRIVTALDQPAKPWTWDLRLHIPSAGVDQHFTLGFDQTCLGGTCIPILGADLGGGVTPILLVRWGELILIIVGVTMRLRNWMGDGW